ncbi:MAG: CDP-diacylglycerol--glycerol-3-phosphate 3-phosphatidyltransferase [Thermotogota bacterium]
MQLNIPTRITLIRVLTIPFLMWLILLSKDNSIYGLISVFVFIAGSLTDWLDGYLARKHNQITNLGKFMDQLADKAFISGALCVLVWNHQVSFWLLAIIIIRDTAVSGIRMLAASKGEVIAANFLGKSKTAVQMVYIAVVLVSFAANWTNELMLTLFAWAVGIITVISGLTYFKGAEKYL